MSDFCINNNNDLDNDSFCINNFDFNKSNIIKPPENVKQNSLKNLFLLIVLITLLLL